MTIWVNASRALPVNTANRGLMLLFVEVIVTVPSWSAVQVHHTGLPEPPTAGSLVSPVTPVFVAAKVTSVPASDARSWKKALDGTAQESKRQIENVIDQPSPATRKRIDLNLVR